MLFATDSVFQIFVYAECFSQKGMIILLPTEMLLVPRHSFIYVWSGFILIYINMRRGNVLSHKDDTCIVVHQMQVSVGNFSYFKLRRQSCRDCYFQFKQQRGQEFCDLHVEQQTERCEFGDVDTGFTYTILRPSERGFFFLQSFLQTTLCPESTKIPMGFRKLLGIVSAFHSMKRCVLESRYLLLPWSVHMLVKFCQESSYCDSTDDN